MEGEREVVWGRANVRGLMVRHLPQNQERGQYPVTVKSYQWLRNWYCGGGYLARHLVF